MAGIKSNLRVVGVVGALAVVAILGIAVPTELWTLHVFLGVAILALTVLLPFFLAPPLEPGQPNDAQQIWLIGPIATLYLWLLSVSVGTIALALLQHHAASLVGVVVWAALFLIGYFGLSAATKVVKNAASQTVTSLLKVSAEQWNTPVNFGSALSTSDCQFSVGGNTFEKWGCMEL